MAMVLDKWRIIRTREKFSGASSRKGDIHRNLLVRLSPLPVEV